MNSLEAPRCLYIVNFTQPLRKCLLSGLLAICLMVGMTPQIVHASVSPDDGSSVRNNRPKFTGGPLVRIQTGTTSYSQVWATDMDPGAGDEGQPIFFEVIEDHGSLNFITAPTIDATSGVLTFVRDPQSLGTRHFNVRLVDDGGLKSAAACLIITVQASTDNPITAVDDDICMREDVPRQINVRNNDTPGALADPIDFKDLPQNGTVVHDPASGVVTYTPNQDFNGEDSFTYYVYDVAGAQSNLGTVTLHVGAVNDPPTFDGGPAIVTDGSNTVLTFPWASNMSPGPPDEQNQTLTFQPFPTSNPAIIAGGPNISSTSGDVNFTTVPDADGVATYSVTLRDGPGLESDPQTLEITVNNQPPTALDDAGTGLEDQPFTVDILINDINPDGGFDLSSFELVTPPTFGTATFNVSSGLLEFSTPPDVNGTTQLKYRIADQGGLFTENAVVSLTVVPVNDAPSFTPGPTLNVISDGIGQTFIDWAQDILPGPTDELLQELVFEVTADGTVFSSPPTISPDGTLSLNPVEGFEGTTTVKTRLRDDGGTSNGGVDVSQDVQFTINVSAPSAALTAGNDSFTVQEDQQDAPFDVLANDNNDTGANVEIFGGPGNGTATWIPTLLLVQYTPNPNFNGSDSFEYRFINPDGAASDTAIVSIAVNAVNDNPTFTPGGSPVVESGSSYSEIWATNIDPGAPDEGGQTLIFLADSVFGASFFDTEPNLSADGTLNFAVKPGAFGNVEYSVVLIDTEGGASSPELLAIEILPPANSPPVANPDSDTLLEDAVSSTAVLANDTDPDNNIDASTLEITTQPDNGTAVVEGTGITYTPDPDYFGPDALFYRVADSDGAFSQPAELSLTIGPVNDPPSFDNQGTVDVTADPKAIQIPGWAFNISPGAANESGQTLEFLVTPVSGEEQFSALPVIDPTSGNLTLQTAPGADGTAQFNVILSDDGEGASQTVQLTINVAPEANNPPVAVDDAEIVLEDTPAGMNLTSNDTDADGTIDIETVAIVQQAANGTATATASGGAFYTPNPDFFGSDSFTYTVMDDDGDVSNIATVTITVDPINDLPFFNAGGTAITIEGSGEQTTEAWATGISPGAPNEAAQTLQFTLIKTSGPDVVAAGPSITPDGNLTFTPVADGDGSAFYDVTLMDSEGGESPVATLEIRVLPAANMLPVANNDSATLDEDGFAEVDVVGNDTDADGTINATTVTLVNFPTNGTFAVNSTNGIVTYTPFQDFNGTDSFTYTVEDNEGGLSDEATVSLTIDSVNDDPTFDGSGSVAITAASGEQTVPQWATNISVGPADESGQSPTFQVTEVSGGALLSSGPTIDPGSGDITLTTAADAEGTATYSVVLTDSEGGASLPQTLVINISPEPNLPPVADPDNESVVEDGSVIVNVLANDSDPDGTIVNATLEVVSEPLNGTLTPDLVNGAFTYDPDPDFFGTDQFTYRVADDDGAFSNVAAVDLTITFVNDPPSFAPGGTVTVTAGPQQQTADWATGMDPGDPNESGQTLQFSVTPLTGSNLFVVQPVIDAQTGVVTFTTTETASGPATFSVTLSDNLGGQSQTETLTIQISEQPNDPPNAVADNESIDEDEFIQIDVLANDSDADGTIDPGTLEITSEPSNGSYLINGGKVDYTPNPDYFGSDSFAYRVADDDGAFSTSATVSININSVNDAPTFTGAGTVGVTAGPAGQTIDGWASNISPGADNEIGQTLNFTITPVSGAGLIASGPSIDPANGNLTFTTAPAADGTATFSVVLADNAGGQSPPQTLTINISPEPNDPPVAVDDGATTDEDVAKLIDILANDSDPDGNLDGNSIEITTPAANGTAQPDGTGKVTYTPNPNYNGPDSFSYRVADDDGAFSNVATVSVSVTAVIDPPVITNDVGTTDEDGSVNVAVLENDSDPDGTLNPGSLVIIGQPANGEAIPNGVTGEIAYTPAADFFGTDFFTYQVSDNDGESGTGSVAVTVNAVNDPPSFEGSGSVSVFGNGQPATISEWAIAISQGPMESGQSLQFNVTPVAGADLFDIQPSIDPVSGDLTFTPKSGVDGTGDFNVVLVDDGGGQNTSQPVALQINLSQTPNVPPTAVDDSGSTAEDTPVQIAVLNNDFDTDGDLDPASLAIVDQSANGTATPNNVTGVVTFEPAQDFNGTTSFTYRVADDKGALTNVATVTVNVSPVDDPPTFTDGGPVSVQSKAGVQTFPAWATNISGGPPDEPQGITFDITVLSGSDLFAALPSIDPVSGDLTFEILEGAVGNASFTIVAVDESGTQSVPVTLQISIAVVPNDPPVAGDDTGQTNEDVETAITVLSNDFDPDGDLDVSSLTIVTDPTRGTAYVNAVTGDIHYAPDDDYFGGDEFTYRVADDKGVFSAAATVSINVVAVNDPPSFVSGGSVSVLTNSGATVVPAWATGIDPGAANESSQSLSFVLTELNGGGALDVAPTIDPNSGDLSFTAGSTAGIAMYSVVLQDDAGGQSPAGTLSIIVDEEPNLPPISDDDSGETSEDVPVVITVLDNDSDPDGTLDPSTIEIVTPPSNGGTSINFVTGAITYTPAQDYFGPDAFSYRVADDDGAYGDPADVNLNVTAIDDPPSFTPGGAVSAVSTPGVHTVPNWATDISPGAANESGQTVNFVVTVNGSSDVIDGIPTIDPDTGTLTFVLTGATGTASFTIVLVDNNGVQSDPVTLSFSIDPEPNDGPIAVDDLASLNEDASMVIDVLGNDSDPDGSLDLTSVEVLSDPLHGTAAVNPTTGDVTFTPEANFFGADQFTYRVADNKGLVSAPATVSLNIEAVNDPPSFAAGGTISSLSGEVKIVTGWASQILAGPDNEAGQSLSFSLVALSGSEFLQGDPVVDATTGNVSFTTIANSAGTARYRLTLLDSDGATSPPEDLVIEISETPNKLPISNADSATGSEDSPIPVDVIANDTDEDGTIDPTTVQIVQDPSEGTVEVDPVTGLVTYTPSADYFGGDSFTYRVSDDKGAQTLPALVGVDVQAVNDPPEFSGGGTVSIVATDTGVSIPAWATGMTAGPANEASQTLSFSVTAISGGNILLDAPKVDPSTGELTFTPGSGVTGTAVYEVVLLDDGGAPNASLPQDLTIVISDKANELPISNDDTGELDEDGNVQIDVLANDSDPDGLLDAATIELLTAPTHGTASIGPNGRVIYTPDADFFGPDQLTYRVQDDQGAFTPSALVNINVKPVNDAPTFVEGGAVSILATGQPVTINGWATEISPGADNENDQDLTFVLGANTGANIFSVPPSLDPVSGTLAFTLTPGASGIASFSVILEDDEGGKSTSELLQIEATESPNQLPLLLDDTASIAEDATATIDVLANDADVDGTIDPSTVDIVEQPLQGTVTVGSGGQVPYRPDADFTGVDVFAYRVADDKGAFGVKASVEISVTPVNDAPSFTASPTIETTATGTPQTIAGWATEIVAGPENENAQALAFEVTKTGGDDALHVDPRVELETGALILVPRALSDGSLTSQYAIVLTDDGGTENGGIDRSQPFTLTVIVSALPENCSITANDDTASLYEDSRKEIDVLGNDPAVDNCIDTSSVTVITNAQNGSTVVNSLTGGITYVPNQDFVGTDEFEYEIRDRLGQSSATAKVTVPVEQVNDAPSFLRGPDVSVDSDSGPVTVPAWATSITAGPPNESDQTVAFIVEEVENPSLFTTLPSVSLDGTLTFTPVSGTAGSSVVRLRLEDSGGDSNGMGIDSSLPKAFRITLGSEQEVLEVADFSYSVMEDTGLEVSVEEGLLSGPDVPSGAIAQAGVAPANGTLELNPDGSFTYVPDQDFAGKDQFTYISGSVGIESAEGVVDIEVLPINDAPSFVAGPQLTIFPGTAVTNRPWATSIVSGPVNESSQTVEFDVAVESNAAAFTTAPTVDTGGRINMEVAPGATGIATILVTLKDSGPSGTPNKNESDPSTLIVAFSTDTGVRPFATPDAYVLQEDMPLDIDAAQGVLSNDESLDGSALTAVLVSGTKFGILDLRPDGSFTFQPSEDYFGETHFVYTSESVNGGGRISDPVRVELVIEPENDPPSFEADATIFAVLGQTNVVIPRWARRIVAGPANERDQSYEFNTDPCPAVFDVDPTVDLAGSMSFTLLPDAPAGICSVGVTMVDEFGARSDVRYVNISIEAPIINLSWPFDGAIGLSTETNLTVFSNSLGASCDVEMASDEAFQNVLVSEQQICVKQTTVQLEAGKEYFWRARFAGGDTWSPVARFRTYPDMLHVQDEISFTSSVLSKTDYRMVAYPGNIDVPISNLMTGVAGDDWNAFYHASDPGTSEGTVIPYDPARGEMFNLVPGRGFWVIGKQPLRIDEQVSAVQLAPAGQASGFEIPVHIGWNIIGNPFDIDLKWDEIIRTNAATASRPIEPIWGFDGAYRDNGDPVFKAGEGYYFFNADDQVASIMLPYTSAAEAGDGAEFFGKVLAADSVDAQTESAEITFRLTNETETVESLASARLHFSADGSEGLDANDRFSPPDNFSTYHISFVDTALELSYNRLSEMWLPEAEEGVALTMRVTNRSGAFVRMSTEGLESIDAEQVMLVDEESLEGQSPDDLGRFKLMPTKPERQYRLLMGSAAFVEGEMENLLPDEPMLLPNYPNPFNGQTTITFGLPEKAAVNLEVYNILGQRVSRLVAGERPAGRHQIMWDGNDNAGIPAASGVYFAVMRTGEVSLTNKMVVIR